MTAPATPPRCLTVDRLAVAIHPTRAAMAQAAAAHAAAILRETLSAQAAARVVFACAPSQTEFLAALTTAPGIAWERVTAFHMDEYVGLAAAHAASFRRYLRENVVSRVRLAAVHELAGEAFDAGAECQRYAALLQAAPLDLVALGIGENGHLAFNDPPVADFADPAAVKPVTLDPACREQQVHDGCFPSLAAVPTTALTLTIPTLLSARRLVGVVPGPRKAAAVRAALLGPVEPSCPASALRTHPAATLFLDADSAAGLG